MIKNITCIECPKGCILSIDVENHGVKSVSGSKCPKGIGYAVSETENPMRIFTSAVLAEGLGIRMIPVRTDKPISKSKMLQAMGEVKRLRIKSPVSADSVIVKGFIEPGVNLIATRGTDD